MLISILIKISKNPYNFYESLTEYLSLTISNNLKIESNIFEYLLDYFSKSFMLEILLFLKLILTKFK